MSLRTLIGQIEHLNDIRSPLMRNIVSMSHFLQTLRELDDLAEMDGVKEAVVRQIQFLLVNGTAEGHMLHSVIYGEPGTGKTTVACLLARLWSTMGIVKKKILPTDELAASRLNAVAKVAIKCQELVKEPDLKRLRTSIDTIVQYSVPSPDIYSGAEPVFVTANRANMIGKYVGHTAPKVKALIEQARGGVFFLDEAYSLDSGHGAKGDSFGNEALTVINEAMSSMQNEVIFIFAGYKDLMEQTIFTTQPGLRRRCTWTFDITAYSPRGLAHIFRKQLCQNQWQIEEDVDLVQFFTANRNSFRYQGGDTERLTFQVKLAYAAAKFNSDLAHDRVITREMIEAAFEQMQKHTVKSDSPPPGMYS